MANKPRYDKIRADVETLTASLLGRLAEVDPTASMLTPEKCLYRIYRDTRFSSDKTPYKTHIGIFMNPPFGKKSLTMGHYLHIEPDNMFFAAGTIGLPPAVLRAVREEIYNNVSEYLSIIDDPEFSELFPEVGENPLKTVPKGFPKEWEHIGLLRPRNYVAWSRPLSEDISRSEMPEFLMPYFRQSNRFNTFFNPVILDTIASE